MAGALRNLWNFDVETMTNTMENTSQVKVKQLVAKDNGAIEKLPKRCLFFEDGCEAGCGDEEGKVVLRYSDLTNASRNNISSSKIDMSMSMSMSEVSSDEGSTSRSSLGVRFNERVERVTYKSLAVREVVKSEADAKMIEMKETHDSMMRLAQAHAAMARASTSASTSALPDVSMDWPADLDDEEPKTEAPSSASSKACSSSEIESQVFTRNSSGSGNGLFKSEFYSSKTTPKESPAKPSNPFNLPSLLKFKKSNSVKA